MRAIVLWFNDILYSKYFPQSMNNFNLKPDTKKQTIQEFFKDLSDRNPICRQCYTHWLKKDLTLEQSLELALKEVTEYCYRLIQPIPADLLVFNGQHLDCVEFVNKSEYPCHVKLKALVEYSAELLEFALKYDIFCSPIQITVTEAEAEKFLKTSYLR
jgi:hypothetical protein